jgi:GTP-binding protein
MLRLVTARSVPLATRFSRVTRAFSAEPLKEALGESVILNPLIRNLAIVAHVDHGKTTLVDKLLGASLTNHAELNDVADDATGEGARLMDSGDLEKERGITITSKPTRCAFNNHVVNIVDTPGHADFAGEVDRIMSMVDGICLVVDGGEGVMSQTKYVMDRAIQNNLKPIVLLNKLDREGGLADVESGQVESDILDLFCTLGATDEQLDYKTFYASARSGWVTQDLAQAVEIVKTGVIPEGVGMDNLLQAFLDIIPPPEGPVMPENEPFSMAATMVGRDQYLGRTVTGKVYSGSAKQGDIVTFLQRTADSDTITTGNEGSRSNAKANMPTPVAGVFCYEGVTRTPLESGVASKGDIIVLAGVPEGIKVGDTVTTQANPVAEPINTPPLAPPTLSMDFGANDGPFAGKEGTIFTSSKIRDRLQYETDNNVTIQVGISETDAEKSVVYARGELQLGILIEQMRREGFEIVVSPPKIVFTKDANGDTLEPFEEVIIDVDSQYAGVIMDKLTSDRKGQMVEMMENNGKTRLRFEAPTRGLLGFSSEAATATRGSAVINHIFLEMRKYAGPLGDGLEKGKIVSSDTGKTTLYALNMLQDRGTLFISPGDQVYAGMVIGENSRTGDLDVNPVKAKQVTNIRTVLKDEKASLGAARSMVVEELIAYMGDDEVIEVTPKSVRLRKKVLNADERARLARTKKKQRDSAKKN